MLGITPSKYMDFTSASQNSVKCVWAARSHSRNISMDVSGHWPSSRGSDESFTMRLEA